MIACGNVQAGDPDAAPDDVTLTVRKTGDGSGRVTSTSATAGDATGIDCGEDCSETYPPDTSVTLTATASSLSTFRGWSGGCSGTGECTVTLTAAATVSAEFTMNACTPNTTVCDEVTKEVIACDGVGSATRTACPLGCHTTEERCNDLEPSNGLAAQLDMTAATADLEVADGSVIDTDAGTITGPGGAVTVVSELVTQTGAPRIRVFIGKSITINDVSVRGANALAFVANGPITVQGRILAAGRLEVAGSGAKTCTLQDGLGADGLHPGTSVYSYPGGGGGGYAVAGAAGGNTPGTNAGAAGVAAGTGPGVVALTPLRGGCRGGGTNHPDQAGIIQVGGGGGGAIQLSSRTAVAIVSNANGTGSIDVGGGGGPQGVDNPFDTNAGGGGGGSGGGVLLEAPAVTVQGASVVIAANGGAGGAGCTAPGGNGTTSAVAAVGGSCFGSLIQVAGGNGGAIEFGGGTIAPTAAQSVTQTSGNRAAGGGGGSYGRVRINTASGEFSLGLGGAIYAAVSVGSATSR